MAENTGKKVSKKALSKSFHNWYYGNLTCFSQEHMQTFGYLVSMLPVVEDLYESKEEQTKALKTYSAFFNTEPQIGSMIVGVSVGLEEARANGEAIDDETINGIRAGLMAARRHWRLTHRRYPDPHSTGHRYGSVPGRLSLGRHLLHHRVEPARLFWYALCVLSRLWIWAAPRSRPWLAPTLPLFASPSLW